MSEIVGKFLSTLPEDDDHPYRTGPWRPQTTEWDADDLTAVEGEIPRDLDGVYLRNTENPLHPALKFYHPFDGDGMMHVVGFRDGKAFYRNRFVRTDGFAAENEAGGPLWPGLAEPVQLAKRDYGWGARTLMKDASSTDVDRAPRHRADELLPVRRPLPARPVLRRHAGQGGLERRASRSTGASRRTRRSTTRTGELLFFNYSKQAPYMHYGVVDAEQRAGALHRRPAAGPAAAARHGVHRELRDPQRLSAVLGSQAAARPTSTCPASTRDMPSRFAVIPRRGGPTTSGGSRPTRRSCCTSPTPTRTATRSCSTASSRATLHPVDSADG